MHQDVDRVAGNKDVPFQNIATRAWRSDRPPSLFRETVHFDILGDGVYAPDTAGRGYGCELFRVAGDVATEGHDTLVDGDSNVLAAEARIKFQLFNDVLPELRVVRHRVLPGPVQ